MADDLSEILNGPSGAVPLQSTPSVTSGAGEDELAKALYGEAPRVAELDTHAKNVLQGTEKSLLETGMSGLARSWGNAKAAVPQLQAVYKEYQGDLPGAVEKMKEAEDISQPYGESEWNLQNIHSPMDFSHWLVEKLGEQGTNLAAMAVTGGVGGLGAKIAAEKLVAQGIIGQTSARAIMLAGGGAMPAALNVGLETAGTAEEQFKVTGSTQPGISLAAGGAKGILESLVPLSVGKALLTPGRQLGRTTLGATAKISAEEGLTEAAQEAIDIYARKISDPGYSYFKDGPTIMPSGWGEGMWRLAESAAAGAAVGWVYGAGPAKFEQSQESRRAVEKGKALGFSFEGSQVPGNQQSFAPSENSGSLAVKNAATEKSADTFGSFVPASIGPITALRSMVIKPTGQESGIKESLDPTPKGDALSLNAILADLKIQEGQKERALDALDASVPRYVDISPRGDKSRILTDTEIELNDAINRPQGEKPSYLKVDQGALQPGAITAHLSDLPEIISGRVYFLPSVREEEKPRLLGDYAQIQQLMQEQVNPTALEQGSQYNLRETRGKQLYDLVLSKGLRVIPSRGAGFYYNGTIDFHGLPQSEIKTTQRSYEVASYNPTTRTIGRFDTNGDISPENLLISVDRNRLNEGDFEQLPSGDIRLKKAWDGSITPGIAPADSQLQDMQTKFAKFIEMKQSGFFLDITAENPDGKRLQETLRKMLPSIDQILEKLGIEQKIFVEITEDSKAAEYGPHVLVDQGVIRFPPSWLPKLGYQGDIDLVVHDVMMHEIGHLVTYHYWRNLPVELQEGVTYAWELAKLSYRMGDSSKVGTGNPTQDIPANIHDRQGGWLTLSEFLAEQFRRWGTSNATPTTILDKTFKEGGKKLEAYYRELEKYLGRDKILNLTQPHYYFSAVMDYLKYDYTKAKYDVKQFVKKWTVLEIPQDVLDSPVLTGIANTVTRAIESLNPMFLPDLKISLQAQIAPSIQIAAYKGDLGKYSFPAGTNLDFIELALSALGDEVNTGELARSTLIHEYQHAYERRGLYTEEELKLLTAEARANQDKLIPPNIRATMMSIYRAELKKAEVPAHEMEERLRQILDVELRAYYLQSFANNGVVFSEQTKTIFARIMAIVERIRNYLNGMGYQTKEDLLKAIFKGEMVHRNDRAQGKAEITDWRQVNQHAITLDGINTTGDATWESNGKVVKAFYDGDGPKKEAKAVTYYWFDPAGTQLGSLELENKGPKGFDVEMISSTAGGMADIMLREAERDLGMKIKPSGHFTSDGFKMAKLGEKFGRVEKGLLDLYQKVSMGEGAYSYFSPNYIQGQVSYWTELARRTQGGQEYKPWPGATIGIPQVFAIKELTKWRAIAARVPKDVWSDPRLEQMFSIRRNNERDEVQGSLIRGGQRADEGQLMQSLGFPGDPKEPFSESFNRKQVLSQGENARRSGIPFSWAAPTSMHSMNIREVGDWLTGAAGSPFNKKDLSELTHNVDRMSWFAKKFYSLQQIAQKNPGNIPLQQIIQLAELAGIIQNNWQQRADQTARSWDKGRSFERREAINKALFDLTETKYLPKGAAVRLPTGWVEFMAGRPPLAGTETHALFVNAGIKLKEDWELIRQIQQDFADFLTESEKRLGDNLRKTFAASPAQLTSALTKLSADMNVYRQKPYFPMVRFGEYTLTRRSAANGPVLATYAFSTQRERDSALTDMRRQFPQDWITRSRVPIHSVEFMGLPAPLLQQIKEGLLDTSQPGLTAEQLQLMSDQKDWIEQFEMLNMPDKTFRKRWMPAKGVPGHSIDGLRTYAHYFQSGSRYLARLAYMKEMRENVQALYARANNGHQGDSAKARMIADYAGDWLNYYLESGKDAGKLRAIAAVWYLGFSPAAAVMNLTQPFFVTFPKMSADFGLGQAFAEWAKAQTYVGKFKGFNPHNYEKGSAEYIAARQEMYRQGYIDAGQAAELASFAESNNLSKLKMGTRLQNGWRKFSYTAMLGFQVAEQYNREVTMRASWNLAMANPGAKKLQEIDVTRALEVQELQSRLGMTPQQAIAFLYSKEAIQRTQFIYNKTSDPPFMRGSKKNLLIFFKYTQNMLFAFGHNGAAVQMLLMFAFFYGLQGLPGSEDANEFLRRVGQWIFGKDWDLHGKARELAAGLTKGSIFDETGPDLLMHGISRYGPMGLGATTHSWWAPRFDASANGSMGKIIPGFAEVMHGFNTGKATNDIFAEGAQKAAGAGYGTVFALLHALNDPGSADSKKWANVLMPRALKAVYEANRYGLSQAIGLGSTEPYLSQPLAATDSKGAKIVKFDPTDPADKAVILAKALGFSATKVNETWEAVRERNDIESLYKTQKSAIMLDMQKAIEAGNPEVINDVLKAIDRFNKDVAANGDPQYFINGQNLRASLKQRMTQKEMTEQTLAKNKGSYGLTQRIMDLYPGVKAERVK